MWRSCYNASLSLLDSIKKEYWKEWYKELKVYYTVYRTSATVLNYCCYLTVGSKNFGNSN